VQAKRTGECGGHNKEPYKELLLVFGEPKYRLPAQVQIWLSVGTREHIETARDYSLPFYSGHQPGRLKPKQASDLDPTQTQSPEFRAIGVIDELWKLVRTSESDSSALSFIRIGCLDSLLLEETIP
jgi:hypothetical protein